ncbi:M24 family metallopeptidase [Paenibacillus hunanensis]|uniref:Xaa-Pro dipeptidase n=1 Tax=Paenibacillus hunanensis TaxID=539262 RepID=A0ABU1IWE5_9BACL|nr:Xaa-Pro peptidase family protein [Paenibacillus hunanensis]MDR6243581.1 Xaa-Pro dipeptidase [Paenibacillus hunanensis]GGI98854.1 Xaa-Pro dipeptidase [Paenibacillus hunanensis]
MDDRIATLRGLMKQAGLDSLLITDPKHVYYLSGFASDPHERFLGLFIPEGNEPFILLPALDADKARSVSIIQRIETHMDTDNPYVRLQQCIGSKVGKLGVEKEHLSVARFEQLAEVLQAEAYHDITSMLNSMRSRKSPEEVERMRLSIQKIEEVLRRGISSLKIGMTELDLVAELEYQMKKVGAEKPAFDTMVLSGPNTALPHGVPGERKLQAGELVMFDLGLFYNGYASDITRTFALGDIDEETSRVYHTVLAANEAAIQATRPGVTFASIDKAARDVITEAGYGQYFIHRLGHGLGMDTHEYPSVHGGNENLLESGVLFTVEPGIYVPGHCGVRIEDDVIVTDQGVDVLSSFPKELTVIG